MTTADRARQRPDLAERAYRIRRNALRMGEVQGQGYIAQALDIADVLAVAYFDAMRYRPEDPDWEGRDRFLLSNGHYAIALYAALFEAGILPEDELETYGSDDSRLPMSGMAELHAGHGDVGRLARPRPHDRGRHGASASSARARTPSSTRCSPTANSTKARSGKALMSAAHWKLDNLIAIVDVNNQQADGPSSQIMAFEPLVRKARSVRLVHAARRRQRHRCREARPSTPRAIIRSRKPRIIVCDTQMGSGVPFLEEREKNHFIRVDAHEWQLALAALDAGRTSMSRIPPAQHHAGKPRLKTSAMIASIAGEGQLTRSAPFGHALVELARDAARTSSA